MITSATSIPPGAGALSARPQRLLGGGLDSCISRGADLELIQILANIGTALTLYPVLRNFSEALSLGFVVARLTVPPKCAQQRQVTRSGTLRRPRACTVSR